MNRLQAFLLSALLLLCLFLAYSNHFHNSFHFDDFHTIVDNPYIRDLRQAPLYFSDARTFSVLPANQSYRPLFTLSTALDYSLGRGLDPFYFHLSNFFWYLVLLLCLFPLYRLVLDRAFPHRWNSWLAWFAATWYGLHTANAETINYISARSDSFSTLGVVAALLLYTRPLAKKYYLYLLPFLLGLLVKPAALMFPLLLFVYILLFEGEGGFYNFRKALVGALPAFLLAGFFFILQKQLTPPTFYPADVPLFNYLITQPFVCLYYFKTFFFPTSLNADYGWPAFTGLLDPRFFAGAGFIAVMLALAIYCSRAKTLRPIAFGIFWFFIALLPSSSLFPLSEVLNDHRIFSPYIGLMLAVCWLIGSVIIKFENKLQSSLFIRLAVVFACLSILLASALGTYQRNQVWRDEASLWYDVVQKSPTNGRGLMNYGLTQMAGGKYEQALGYFQRAKKFAPRYPFLHINLGIASGALGRPAEAEAYFKNALALGPGYYGSYFYYARWLAQQGRRAEAIPLLRQAVEISPGFLASSQLLEELNAGQLQSAKQAAKANPAPENYLNLSLAYYNAGKYLECVAAANQALKLRPRYAAAYNNIGAAYNALRRFDEAIVALEKALLIKPDFELAGNNLRYARRQK